MNYVEKYINIIGYRNKRRNKRPVKIRFKNHEGARNGIKINPNISEALTYYAHNSCITLDKPYILAKYTKSLLGGTNLVNAINISKSIKVLIKKKLGF